jgi:hypothetical protein
MLRVHLHEKVSLLLRRFLQQVLGEYGAEASSQASSSGVIQGSGMRTNSFKRTNKL